MESGSVASQPCGGSRIPFHSVRATGFGVRVWLLVALIPSPSPGGRREHLAGGLGFVDIAVARMERSGIRERGVTTLRGSRIPFHSVRATGFGSAFGSWSPSSPALLPEGEGSVWMHIGSAHGCAHPGHRRYTFILTGFLLFPRFRALWAVSSAVEHCLHTAGVTGSIPVPPTIFPGRLRSAGNLGAGSRVGPCTPRCLARVQVLVERIVAEPLVRLSKRAAGAAEQ